MIRGRSPHQLDELVAEPRVPGRHRSQFDGCREQRFEAPLLDEGPEGATGFDDIALNERNPWAGGTVDDDAVLAAEILDEEAHRGAGDGGGNARAFDDAGVTQGHPGIVDVDTGQIRFGWRIVAAAKEQRSWSAAQVEGPVAHGEAVPDAAELVQHGTYDGVGAGGANDHRALVSCVFAQGAGYERVRSAACADLFFPRCPGRRRRGKPAGSTSSTLAHSRGHLLKMRLPSFRAPLAEGTTADCCAQVIPRLVPAQKPALAAHQGKPA